MVKTLVLVRHGAPEVTSPSGQDIDRRLTTAGARALRTAYPRVSKVFSDPDGLATIEALYAALKFSGSPDPTVLKGYPFAKKFIEINGWLSDIPSADFFDESESVFCD